MIISNQGMKNSQKNVMKAQEVRISAEFQNE